MHGSINMNMTSINVSNQHPTVLLVEQILNGLVGSFAPPERPLTVFEPEASAFLNSKKRVCKGGALPLSYEPKKIGVKKKEVIHSHLRS